jgi:hypothetical protein
MRLSWATAAFGLLVALLVLFVASCSSMIVGHAAHESVFRKCSETERGRRSSGVEIDYQWSEFAFRCRYGGGPPDYKPGAGGTMNVPLSKAFSGD